MAVALRVAGSWAEYRADGSVTIPATPQAGDRMFLFVAWKTYTITLTTPNGWTGIGTAYADGTTAAGNGTGSVRVMAFYRDWQDGDANPFLDFSSSPSEAAAVITVWQKAETEIWSTPLTATAALSWGSGSTTTSASSTVAVPSGGVVLALVAFRDDSATMTRPTTAIDDDAAAITWNGNHVESPATHGDYTAGLDGSYDLGYRLVTTGATATLRVTGTLSASETGSAKWVVQGVITGIFVYAPLVTASVVLPPKPVGVEGLTGRLGHARLGYGTLGDEGMNGSHLDDAAWVQTHVYPDSVAITTSVQTPSVTRASYVNVDAPLLEVAVVIPGEVGIGGTTGLTTGRLGVGRLGYLSLGAGAAGGFSSFVSAIADVGGTPSTIAVAAATADGTAQASLSTVSVDAPLITASGDSYAPAPAPATFPATVTASGAVPAAFVGPEVFPAAVTAAADVLLMTGSPAAVPSTTTAAAAVQDGTISTSAATTMNAPVVTATGSTTTSTPAIAYPAELVTTIASPAAAVANLAGIGPLATVATAARTAVANPAGVLELLAASAAVTAGAVEGNPNVTVDAPLVTVSAAPAAAIAALAQLPALATATASASSAAAGVGFVPDTVTMAASVSSAGTSTWKWAAPVTVTAAGSVTIGSTSTLGVGTVAAPLVTALAYPRAAEVEGRVVGKGPDGDASAIVPRASAEHAAPSGSAMNVRTP